MVRQIGSVVGSGSLGKSPKSPQNQRNEKVSFPTKSKSLPVRMSQPFSNHASSNAEKLSTKKNLPHSSAESANEISKVMMHAKPSEIRAAVKAERIASKPERERRQRMLQSQQEAQMKMDKIRAEIDAIKIMESCRNLTIIENAAERKSAPITVGAAGTAVLALEPSSTEDILVPIEKEEISDSKLQGMGQKLMKEMEASFAQHRVTASGLSRSSNQRDPNQTQENAEEKIPPPLIMRCTVSGARNQRRPSNLVPEMRRRASNHDLFFDDAHLHTPSSTLLPMSTHSPVTGSHLTDQVVKSEKLDENRGMSASTVHVTSSGVLPNSGFGPSSSRKSSTINISEPTSSTPIRCSSTSAYISPNKEVAIAKWNEEKQKADAQKKKLDEAKRYFQEGHDLCWKMQDSAGALGGYRKALFIRESLLGKYHDDTGRTYYWIGRSLVKLKEYDEALVAFSRSYRIFDRVLTKNHKYNKWAKTAIMGVFQEMNDSGRFSESYQKNLDNSIAHERAGDAHRKMGRFDDAISEYRAAISNIEECHPDSADLHCKIAMILRRKGEFEKALEENRSALEIYELSLGPEHPETVKTLNQTLEKKRLNQVSLALMEKLDFGK
ncbi:expressed tetratricopeptide repeat protein [Nitzschia inconspicua]|uniref:Expressed tetratricopeptide repeat protein n=1 Tax=Nitzschia inconspicua TaxID=303405 RepID=A0A9K3Q2R4_9STRA|nr:expressed tetratricopeptide repeat protein [Nitzschia inconspicua]